MYKLTGTLAKLWPHLLKDFKASERSFPEKLEIKFPKWTYKWLCY